MHGAVEDSVVQDICLIRWIRNSYYNRCLDEHLGSVNIHGIF